MAAPPPACLPALALSLALRATPASASAFIASLPAPRASALAAGLGHSPRGSRASLRSLAAWARAYRSRRGAHAAACAAQWAAAARRCFGAGGAAGVVPLLHAVAHIMQPAAGTAVLLSPRLALTCAHCVSAEGDAPESADSEDSEASASEGAAPTRVGRLKLLLTFSGAVLAARCVAVDEGADLALLRVEAAGGGPLPEAFPRVLRACERSPWGARVVCNGNPSEFNGEAARETRIRFAPPVFHTSGGRLVGATASAQRGLGGSEHTCWTYWGHSGAPLLDAEGRVVGLHNSWDPGTGTRHAVTGEAVGAFVASFLGRGGAL
jgi:hypothetical protein